jgi:hypothetical protein
MTESAAFAVLLWRRLATWAIEGSQGRLGLCRNADRASWRVQDRYAGDLGDFLKFGLLRQHATGDGHDRPMRLGVVRYRTADDSHNADGKHVGYLEVVPDALEEGSLTRRRIRSMTYTPTSRDPTDD